MVRKLVLIIAIIFFGITVFSQEKLDRYGKIEANSSLNPSMEINSMVNASFFLQKASKISYFTWVKYNQDKYVDINLGGVGWIRFEKHPWNYMYVGGALGMGYDLKTYHWGEAGMLFFSFIHHTRYDRRHRKNSRRGSIVFFASLAKRYGWLYSVDFKYKINDIVYLGLHGSNEDYFGIRVESQLKKLPYGIREYQGFSVFIGAGVDIKLKPMVQIGLLYSFNNKPRANWY